MALLEVRGLEKWYGKRKVVDGVSFEVNPGEIVGLLGPNGAGKTTSFRMATGQIVPNGGTVIFNNEDVTTFPMYRRARLGMGYLSQEQSIFRKLTVEKNLLAILEALPRSRTLGRRLTSAERWARTESALARFNLTHVRKNVAARCSGGEKRRLEIARCLVCEPLLILLDEPFAAVDPKTTEDIRKNIRDLADNGIGILLTDHNVREVVKTADRIYLIVEGQVVCHGTPADLIKNPIAIDAYLGSTFEDDVLMARVAGFIKEDPVPLVPQIQPVSPPPDRQVAPVTLQPAQPEQQVVVSPPPPPPAPVPPPPPPARQPEPITIPKELLDDPQSISLAPVVIDQPSSEPPITRAPTPPSRSPAPRSTTQTASIVVEPKTKPVAVPAPAPEPASTPAMRSSSGVHQLLEQEKMRRFVEQLRDRNQMPTAWHELASRGDAAIPILLEALERRELEIRHLAFRLLESVTGEQLVFQSDAPDEVRLRQVAHLRKQLENRG